MAEHVPQTARGYEEPFGIQFSVFLANRVGQLRELLSVLEQGQVEVAGLSIVDSTDWAVVRVVFTEPMRAREVLHRYGLPFTESQVLLVELQAGEATMSEICRLLVAAECNIHFAYPLMVRRHDCPVLVLHVDEHVLARQLLARHGMTLLGNEDLSTEAA